jgi:thiamine biosynthesis lipoprotein
MTRQHMATFFTISIARPDAGPELFEEAFGEIRRVDELMSVYRPDSEVSRINHQAGVEPVAVSPQVVEVISLAREISRRSGGRFDITYASVHPGTSYRAIRIDKAASTVFLPHAGMRIDLGAIAKGYAVDLAGRYLRRKGIDDFIINGGGDMLVAGRRYGSTWHVGIRDPADRDRLIHTLAVGRDLAVATSGDYEQPGHIRDPLSRRPIGGIQSVTVVAPTAAAADGYATAIFVLGQVEGMNLVEKHPQLEVLLVDSAGGEKASSGFWSMFE